MWWCLHCAHTIIDIHYGHARHFDHPTRTSWTEWLNIHELLICLLMKEWFNYCIHLNDHHQNHSKEQINGTQTESGLTFKWLWCSISSYRKRQSQWAKCKLSAWLYDVTWVMEEFLRRKIDGYREKGDKTSNVLILVRLDFLAFFGV